MIPVDESEPRLKEIETYAKRTPGYAGALIFELVKLIRKLRDKR